MKIKAIVEVELDMGERYTFEEAEVCLYNLLFDGLCRNANSEFWIDSVEEID